MSKFRRIVFIVTYTIDKGKIYYVLEERKKHWSGWEFPKGGIEFWECKRKTVKRELLEETSLIPLKIKNHCKKGKYFYPRKLKDRPGVIGDKYYLYSALTKKGKLKIDKKEHTKAKWVTFQTAKKLITFDDQKKDLEKVNLWILNHFDKLERKITNKPKKKVIKTKTVRGELDNLKRKK